jgi:2-oxoglutarate ferredoxin oxidoreductase subunit gamma
MRTEIRVTGTGGQGAITVGHILGRAAAIHDGKEVVVTEGYSPYITGGWSRADIVVSDMVIDYPLVSRLDALVTMYQEGLSLNAKLVKPSGVILVESQLVDPAKVKTDRRTLSIPATAEAQALGRKVLTNVVLLGALLEATNVVSKGSLEKALAERFPRFVELNLKALNAGIELARGATKEGVLVA